MKDEDPKPVYIPEEKWATVTELAIATAVFIGVMAMVTFLFCIIEISNK